MLSKPLKIKIELLKKGVTGGDIGRTVGVSRSAVSQTIDGKIKSSRIRKEIAKVLGMKVSDLWPDDDRKAA